MASEYINHRDVETAEELREALDVLLADAGEHASAVYVCHPEGTLRLTLEEETLTDGSTVKNIRVGRA